MPSLVKSHHAYLMRLYCWLVNCRKQQPRCLTRMINTSVTVTASQTASGGGKLQLSTAARRTVVIQLSGL